MKKELKPEDIEIFDSSVGFTVNKAFTLAIYSLDKGYLEQLWEIKNE